MSQPLIMSFRPEAADMCLDGRKRETRRPMTDGMTGIIVPYGGLVRIERNGRKVWEAGEQITIKRNRTGRGIGKVLCTSLCTSRIQTITNADAIREGMTQHGGLWSNGDDKLYPTPRAAFEALWKRMYPRGPNSWGKNRVVVVIRFRPKEE